MNLADISIRRPVLMTMLIMTLVVLGIFSLTRLGIDLFPKVEFPFVVVTLIYPGAGPEEMETAVCEPVEEEISSISGLRHVTSTAQEGLVFVAAEFDLGVDVDVAAADVREKIDRIRSRLPRDIQDPVIQKFDFAALPIMDFAVSSPKPLEETYRLADEVVKRGLSRVAGVAGIQITGGREKEIRIHLSRKNLKEHNLAPELVIGQIAYHNLNVPTGHIVEGRREITIRLEGEFRNLDDIRKTELSLDKEKKIRLDQIARIEESFKEQRDRSSYNGESSVGVSLIKKADANTVQVAKGVHKELASIRKVLPPDVRIDIARDRSQFIQDSVDDVFGNLIVGALLTAFILFIFLHNLPSTLIAAITIPVSVVSTFILVDFAGFTLNFMSLMGLAISVGILTCNSIVVLENIERYRVMGHSQNEAASKGTREIALAVAASTLTNVVVFTPMAFMSGITGQFFKQFGLTVTFATMISLLMSFTLTPMMAARPVKKSLYLIFAMITWLVIWWRMGIDTAIWCLLVLLLLWLAHSNGWLKLFAKFWDSGYNNLVEDYRRTLSWALDHKGRVISAIVLLFAGSFLLLPLGFIGAEFFPKADQGALSISVEMPVGCSLAETDKVVDIIARRMMKEPYITSVYTTSGRSEGGIGSSGQGVNLGSVVVQMLSRDYRPYSVGEYLETLRPKLADIPAAKITVKEAQSMGGGSESDIQVEIQGHEMDELIALADSVQAAMYREGGMVNIASSWRVGKPELKMTPRRRVIADLGFSPAQIGMTLRNLIEGAVVSKFRQGGEEYDIRVKLDPEDVTRTSDLDALYMKSGDKSVKLSELVEMTNTEGPTSISHKDKERIVYVTADVSGTSPGQAAAKLRKFTDTISLKPGYTIYYGGQTERMEESFSELLKALLLAIILTYMLIAAMLESFKHPFTIMLTLPLGLVGVMLALFLTGNNISMFALMAMVMLVGIVVNNAILLIDYTNERRKAGLGIREALLDACPIRLRPILMTNLASAIGMLPLALGIGAGGEFRAPLAIVSIGGLISSTVFTLYVIPIIYRMFEKE